MCRTLGSLLTKKIETCKKRDVAFDKRRPLEQQNPENIKEPNSKSKEEIERTIQHLEYQKKLTEEKLKIIPEEIARLQNQLELLRVKRDRIEENLIRKTREFEAIAKREKTYC